MQAPPPNEKVFCVVKGIGIVLLISSIGYELFNKCGGPAALSKDCPHGPFYDNFWGPGVWSMALSVSCGMVCGLFKVFQNIQNNIQNIDPLLQPGAEAGG